MSKHIREADLDLTDINSVVDFIYNSESSMYGAKSQSGEDIIVLLEKGVGMEIRIHQENGWVRVVEYGEDGFPMCEWFDGRWDAE